MYLKQLVWILFILTPFLTFAHGEEVLIWFGVEGITLAIIVIFIAIVELKAIHKLVLSVVYIISQIIVVYTTADIPYAKNSLAINIASGLGPILLVGGTYLVIIRNKRNQKE